MLLYSYREGRGTRPDAPICFRIPASHSCAAALSGHTMMSLCMSSNSCTRTPHLNRNHFTPPCNHDSGGLGEWHKIAVGWLSSLHVLLVLRSATPDKRRLLHHAEYFSFVCNIARFIFLCVCLTRRFGCQRRKMRYLYATGPWRCGLGGSQLACSRGPRTGLQVDLGLAGSQTDCITPEPSGSTSLSQYLTRRQ
jgi:hypothetical protein